MLAIPKKLLFVFILMLSLTQSYGQKDSIRVRVFDGGGNELYTSKPNTPEEKNYFNFSIYLLGRGAFVLGYERMLHRKHSIAIDAGITYRDFIYEALVSETIEEEATPGFGHYVSLNYKFYPKDYSDFDGGIYISPGVINRSYSVNYDIEYYTGTTYKTAVVNGNYSFTDYSFKFGYVTESWFFDDLIGDVYFGVGLRKSTLHSYEIESQTVGEKIVETTETKQRPAIYFGVKLGFSF